MAQPRKSDTPPISFLILARGLSKEIKPVKKGGWGGGVDLAATGSDTVSRKQSSKRCLTAKERKGVREGHMIGRKFKREDTSKLLHPVTGESNAKGTKANDESRFGLEITDFLVDALQTNRPYLCLYLIPESLVGREIADG